MRAITRMILKIGKKGNKETRGFLGYLNQTFSRNLEKLLD